MGTGTGPRMLAGLGRPRCSPGIPQDLGSSWCLPRVSGVSLPPAGSLVCAQVTSETKQVPENSAVDIPCTAYKYSMNSPRIEWKFQKGTSLVLLYYGNELTEPYKNRVQFSSANIHFSTVTREDTGKYICEVVEGSSQISKSEVNLIVQVPPSKPVAHVPTSATIGSKAVLRCTETDGSPPPTFRWYRDTMLMPSDPKTSLTFRNSSYTLDSTTGELIFEPVSSFDTGDYYCEASNNVGSPQKSDVVHMEANEVNVGGIVAAVVVLLMVLALIAFGIWFAYSRGFFSKRKDTTSKKVIYSQPSHRSEGEFKQTSSFLV
ncbi:junctional adhesion molecule A isoform X1 [Cygnus olor]|uniref:junctional adhesion molecule A isoform X1 n=1 Tax=Cygnus olor TaxID=8869 RepID=UPI001ADDE790|nr:junctional adhesion molecule A isoform X1 [Cygnus olor]